MKNIEFRKTLDYSPQRFGLGVCIGNEQPKSQYKTACLFFSGIIICWVFNLQILYPYKTTK